MARRSETVAYVSLQNTPVIPLPWRHRMSRSINPAATTALLLTLLASPLAAQRWSVGVLGGANRSTVGGSDAEGAESRIGMAGGVQLVRTLGNNVALEVNALYSMKGAKQEEQGASVDVRLGYLELPLLLRIGPNTDGTVRPFATVGASAAFQLSCTAEAREMGMSASANCDEVATFRSFDATLIGGAGLDASLGSGTMTVAVRYGYGLLDIVEDAEVRNRAFTLLAGWRIPIGRK